MERTSGGPSVILVNGDPVAGQALTLLLQTTSYNVRFASQSALDDPAEDSGLLDGVQLALFTPGTLIEHYERVLALLRSRPDTADVPILQLGAAPEEVRAEVDYLVPWPCRIEDLRRRIGAALRNRPQPINDDTGRSLLDARENEEGA